MVKLVDMPDLGSGAARRVGSSPIIRTKSPNESLGFFCGFRARSLSRFIGKDYYPHKKSFSNREAFFWNLLIDPASEFSR